MKSKTTKPSALKVFNDNKVTANKKADVAMKSFKKSLPKAQYGRTKEDINIKNESSDFPGSGNYTDGYKTSRTNPITGKTVEKSKVTNSQSHDYKYGAVSDVRTRTVKDKAGKVIKEKTKTFDLKGKARDPFYEDAANKVFNKYNKSRVKPLYSVDKKTVVKTKNGEGIEKTNNYIGGNKFKTLSKDKGKSFSGKERKKVSVPVQKTGGATKATKFAALAPPYNKATAADRIAGAKKNKKK